MAVYIFNRKQVLPVKKTELWKFISDPGNLSEITPESMKFSITSPDFPENIYPGLMISYRVSPFPGLRVTWVTEITHVREGSFFVDEQRKGPYRLWHHEHLLKTVTDGTLMDDTVTYIPPLGILGSLANVLIISRKLEDIFVYREQKLKEIFRVT